jgi:hypothetical protein
MRCLHTDALPLATIGNLTIRRASVIEWDEMTQQWGVQIVLEDGSLTPVLWRHESREECLDFERQVFDCAEWNHENGFEEMARSYRKTHSNEDIPIPCQDQQTPWKNCESCLKPPHTSPNATDPS